MSYFEANISRTKKQLSTLQQKKSFVVDDLNNKVWIPSEGHNNIRILPPWSSNGDWCYQFGVHWDIGVERRSIICPRITLGKLCPICVYAWSVKKEKNDLYLNIRVTKRYMANMLDLDNIKNGVQIWTFGVQNFQELAEYMVGFSGKDYWGDFTHPEKGYNIRVTRYGKGKTSKTSVKLFPQSEPLVHTSYLDQLHDLDSALIIDSEDVLQSIVDDGINIVPVISQEVDTLGVNYSNKSPKLDSFGISVPRQKEFSFESQKLDNISGTEESLSPEELKKQIDILSKKISQQLSD